MTTTRKKKTVFKKTDMCEMLLELYKIAAAEGRGYGSMKTQLISSTLFGMAVLCGSDSLLVCVFYFQQAESKL